MFFDSWAGLVRVVVIGTLTYAALVLFLRISGKRTLTKLNAFDLVVTVALGSTLATVLLSKSVALAEGVLALALLILLQFVVAWLSVRSERFQSIVKAEPTLLVRRGRFLDGAMRAQRITREEVLAAMRGSGESELGRIAAVVLETDGSISVISDAGRSEGASTLANVEGAEEGGRAVSSSAPEKRGTDRREPNTLAQLGERKWKS